MGIIEKVKSAARRTVHRKLKPLNVVQQIRDEARKTKFVDKVTSFAEDTKKSLPTAKVMNENASVVKKHISDKAGNLSKVASPLVARFKVRVMETGKESVDAAKNITKKSASPLSKSTIEHVKRTAISAGSEVITESSSQAQALLRRGGLYILGIACASAFAYGLGSSIPKELGKLYRESQQDSNGEKSR